MALPSVCILVVVYGKHFSESTTLASLRLLDLSNVNKLNLKIWNNDEKNKFSNDDVIRYFADSSLDDFDKLRYIEVINSSSNAPLSSVYNQVALSCKENYNILVLLDDDSFVPSNFINYMVDAYMVDAQRVKVPLAYSNNKLISPTKKNLSRISYIKEGLVEGNDFSAIGSGLVIPTEIFDFIRFDENLRFYGVDHDFIATLLDFNKVEVVHVRLEHSLSTDVIDNRNFSLFKIDSLIYSMLYNGVKHKNYLLSMYRASKLTIKMIYLKKNFSPLYIFIRNLWSLIFSNKRKD